MWSDVVVGQQARVGAQWGDEWGDRLQVWLGWQSSPRLQSLPSAESHHLWGFLETHLVAPVARPFAWKGEETQGKIPKGRDKWKNS